MVKKLRKEKCQMMKDEDLTSSNSPEIVVVKEETKKAKFEQMFQDVKNGDNGEEDDENEDEKASTDDDDVVAKDNNGRVVKKKRKRYPVYKHEHIIIIDEDPPMYQCNVCQKEFKTKEHIKYHEFCKKGDKPFKCEECGKGFITKSHYEYHLRTHTGERPFICPTCGKGFNQRGKVTRHMLSHTGEKPFTCQECKQKFSNAQALKSHSLVHTGERPFACTYCDKRFTGMTNLKKHVITHTGERPFSCNECGKSFGLKWTLDLHLRIHSTERPFACDQCSSSFSTEKDLRRHLVIHSGERPFRCGICQKAFGRQDNLNRHIKTRHKLSKEGSKKLAIEAAAKYLKLKSKNQSSDEIPVSKVSSTVIRNVIENSDLLCAGRQPNNMKSNPSKGPGLLSTNAQESTSSTTFVTVGNHLRNRRISRVITHPSPPLTSTSRSKQTEIQSTSTGKQKSSKKLKVRPRPSATPSTPYESCTPNNFRPTVVPFNEDRKSTLPAVMSPVLKQEQEYIDLLTSSSLPLIPLPSSPSSPISRESSSPPIFIHLTTLTSQHGDEEDDTFILPHDEDMDELDDFEEQLILRETVENEGEIHTNLDFDPLEPDERDVKFDVAQLSLPTITGESPNTSPCPSPPQGAEETETSFTLQLAYTTSPQFVTDIKPEVSPFFNDIPPRNE